MSDEIVVIQADRDRAREWLEGVCGKYLANQREHDLLADLFALHRLAEQERCAGVAEKEDGFALVAKGLEPIVGRGHVIATAIRGEQP